MKYKSNMAEIDAVQWDGTLKGLDQLYMEYGEAFSNVAVFKFMTMEESVSLTIRTTNGNIKVNKGDYIIRNSKGDIYPCRSDIFNETYIKGEQKCL